ncbi:MAG: hypothetical protein JXA67_22180 [Micromonosporaceae bacterium]|nr:hypothetical protein [Micromonosporaceae bacterium]
MVTVRTRSLAWWAALTLSLCSLLGSIAAPSASANPGDRGESEGTISQLRATLERASRGYVDAKAALERSRQRQAQLSAEIIEVETQLAGLTRTANDIAVAAFKTGGLVTASALVSSDSPDLFLDRASAIRGVTITNDRQLRALTETKRRLVTTHAALSHEIASGQRHLDAMVSAKNAAEQALAASGGGQPASGPGGTWPRSSSSQYAPSGGWPSEGCSVNDPTTRGCITPRMLRALQHVWANGFSRTVSCYRSGGSGEHPKGRACDFASAQRSFGGVATGQDRAYGDRLAWYLVANADALAVLYVIWFRQVWLPSSGWRSYSGCGGDPSSDHTNHVHLSVY